MNYLRVRWVHQYPNEPVLLLSELDTERYEVRKIEVFADGRKGFASSNKSFGGTVLGERPIPPPDEIALDRQFVVESTDANDFEAAWSEATKRDAAP